MNATIDRRLMDNERMRRNIESAIERQDHAVTGAATRWQDHPDARSAISAATRQGTGEGRPTPRAILASFFTWLLCVVGFMAAMTALTTLTHLLKMLAH
jgi:hypothetical protein